MKKIIVDINIDTCYIGENRIDMRFSFVDGVKSCKSSCPDEKIYLVYDENVISVKEIRKIIEEMEFKINKIKIIE